MKKFKLLLYVIFVFGLVMLLNINWNQMTSRVIASVVCIVLASRLMLRFDFGKAVANFVRGKMCVLGG